MSLHCPPPICKKLEPWISHRQLNQGGTGHGGMCRPTFRPGGTGQWHPKCSSNGTKITYELHNWLWYLSRAGKNSLQASIHTWCPLLPSPNHSLHLNWVLLLFSLCFESLEALVRKMESVLFLKAILMLCHIPHPMQWVFKAKWNQQYWWPQLCHQLKV